MLYYDIHRAYTQQFTMEIKLKAHLLGHQKIIVNR